jgi:hypothetical protein
MLRWPILSVLLTKEVLRHRANRGGLALLLLLVVASLLLAFGGRAGAVSALSPNVKHCYVDYWQDDGLIEYLRGHTPTDLKDLIEFRCAQQARTDADGRLVYPPNTGAIQVRASGGTDGTGLRVEFWHPGADGASLAPFEAWFWRETYHYRQQQVVAGTSGAGPTEEASAVHAELTGGMDARSAMASSLVLFGLFFVCVYLLSSLTCEERERGVLLAQALSPATAAEILGARFLFYAAMGMTIAAILAGVYEPRVLLRPFFWAVLVVSAAGSMGVGLTISALARTQRAASMGAMCYLLAVSLLLFLCQQNGVPGLSYLALEYHCPRLLHAALTGAVHISHYGNLVGAGLLAIGWTGAALVLFRRQGWQ